MFEVLIGSSDKRDRMVGRGVASALCHAVAIVGVVHGSAGEPPPTIRKISICYDCEGPPPPPGPTLPPAGRTGGKNDDGGRIPDHAGPVAPVYVPTGIPPVTITDKWSPSDFLGPSKARAGVAHGAGTRSGMNVEEILAEAEVDEPAGVLVQRAPRYPRVLQAAGIEGRVLVRFVIDSGGRVEPGSLRIVASEHPGFDEAAREAVSASVFRPGRVRGRAVRQWVEQSVAFRLTP